ncbi:MAG: DUF1926 domain-containing protein [Candidatus Lokiarchaeota archaeon]|nr:DUF1926 domain-containing protein [Candidatus Lokiarchaeota archaeon]
MQENIKYKIYISYMSIKIIYFPLVFHFHQPVDNFEWVFEESYEKAYKPLLEQMYKHYEVKFTLHFTGSLLEWLLQKPEFKSMLKEMVSRDQVEIIGGGYYEPIYAIIPERDRIEQMNMLTNAVKQELGYKVSGAWLSERVWEPNYPSFLSKAGLNYVIVDDNHLRGCGLSEEETFYSYVTEDNGSVITVFPINEIIRHLAPWKPAKETIKYLEENADEKGNRIILFLSDAEKMGVWGTTNELCYIKGHPQEDERPYIDELFSLIEKSQIIKPITLNQYMKRHGSNGRVYIPTATYDKMEEWVLPSKVRKQMSALMKQIKKDKEQGEENIPKEITRFIKGGFWRYFLVKYPESNNMHKRMLYVREELLNLEDEIKNRDIQEEKKSSIQNKIKKAWDEIYRAQCNDCYWHGQFGGVYLHFFRHAVYSHLIEAEKIVENIAEQYNLNPIVKIQHYDFDRDSYLDLIVKTKNLWLCFKPNDGATCFELDSKPHNYNLLNTLTRWLESYHKKEDDIPMDRWRKTAFRDHFVDKSVSLESFSTEKYDEYGDFVDGIYNVDVADENKRHILTFQKQGNLKIVDSEGSRDISMKLSKQIEIDHETSMIDVDYQLQSEVALETIDKIHNYCMAIDLPFIFSGDENDFKCIVDGLPQDLIEKNQIAFEKVSFQDPQYNIEYKIRIPPKADGSQRLSLSAYKYPIYCYARTNSGYKNIYQGMNLAIRIEIQDLVENGLKFKLEFNDLK